MNQGITPSRAPEPVGAYPPAGRVGNLLFFSGQGPAGAATRTFPACPSARAVRSRPRARPACTTPSRL